jgi:2-iminobutanoate/2-iminopropanoate deaminase
MPRQILKSSKLYTPKFRYSPCVKTGPWYTMSGMVALDPATNQLVGTGAYVEARQIMQLMVAALPDWGLTLENIASARIYTTRMDQFPEINRAWEEVFVPSVEPPARTSIGVAALPLGASVEIEFTLYKED